METTSMTSGLYNNVSKESNRGYL